MELVSSNETGSSETPLLEDFSFNEAFYLSLPDKPQDSLEERAAVEH